MSNAAPKLPAGLMNKEQAETAMNEFTKLLERKEALHPDLAACLTKPGRGSSLGWPMLKHPLLFAVPYMEMQNALYNEQYRYKQKAVEEAREKGKWGSFIFLHERPHRFEAFDEIAYMLTDEEYWELLGKVWSDTENLWQIYFISRLLRSPRGSRERMMDEKERAFLAKLPDQFMIYRGHHTVNRRGYSWTLSYNKAKWFAHRFQRAGHVAIASVRKEHVIAYLGGRNELEIVVDPANIEFKTLRKLSRPGILEIILDDCKKAFPLDKGWSDHGPHHWEKVERNAIALAKKTKGADELVCRLFAITHDCQRENEMDDPRHGYRAAEFILKNRENWMLKELKGDRLEKLLHACRLHNDGQVSDDPTVGVCWDADRLDLSRVGIVPDPKFLSTEAGRNSIWLI